MWRNWKPSALLIRLRNGVTTMENGMMNSQKIKQNCCMIQKFHFWIYIQKKFQAWSGRDHCTPCLWQHYS